MQGTGCNFCVCEYVQPFFFRAAPGIGHLLALPNAKKAAA